MKSSIFESLNWAHPLIQEWFTTHLGNPTAPQIAGWPSILSPRPTLISAPTGSGKTLAAFLVCINELLIKSISGNLENKTEILYISPIKALGNDIHKNLTEPLHEIEKLATVRGYFLSQKIEIAVRSGDTPTKERQQMLKKPPHILVTTPESLYILLTAEKSREKLKEVKTVIVDEIHALIGSKRGSHLALSLERLQALTSTPPIRIGLSATQNPMDLVAKFLQGSHPTPPNIVNIGYARSMDLTVGVPKTELSSITSNEMWDEIYDKIAQEIKHNRSTLVFVNTRRLAERVAHHLSERIGEEFVAAHHGSLSRKLRHSAETRLKKGELKALVATASLELGIDIGTVDLVCQIGTPRSINIALQRIGRSGHRFGAISKAIFFATTRDDLLESAALLYAIHQGKLDKLIMPLAPLDILTQQIVATLATGDWLEDELYLMVKGAYPYQTLSRETFNRIIEMLSEGIAGSRGRYGAYLFRDKVNGRVIARRGARLNSIMSGGAIPESGLFTVVSESEEVVVGTLDEDFAIESNRGDVILLGTTSWQIQKIDAKAGKVYVENAKGAPPSVPFWQGEAPGRTNELSEYVSLLRETLDYKEEQKTSHVSWLRDHCGLNEYAAKQLLSYLTEGKAVLGNLPTKKTVIAERFFDEGGGMQLVLHAPFGMAINKTWGLALRKKFCRSFNFELQAQATDNGLNISLAEQHSFPLQDVFHFLHPHSLKEVLTQAVLQSPIFKTRWRWTATRSLALLRFKNGRKVPPNIQRMLSDDLLAAVFPDAAACQDNLGGRNIEPPDHPLIKETLQDVLTDALDLEGLTAVIKDIKENKIECLAIDTSLPSLFSHEILNANPYAFLDDAPLEERRARAVELRRILPDSINEIGSLSPEAIAEVQEQAWPDIRNEDELQDALQSFIAFPEDILVRDPWAKFIHEQDWRFYFDKLLTQSRASLVLHRDKRFWVAAEKQTSFKLLYPESQFLQTLKNIPESVSERDTALKETLRGWMLHIGPITASELSHMLDINLSETEVVLLNLENTGLILRGRFRPTEENQNKIEWCERRLLARIHKSTIYKLRQEIEPVDPKTFIQWLLKWQHLSPDTQLSGKKGLMEVIRQLQGFELPANVWEPFIFTKRVKEYDKTLLDTLCLTGEVGFGRFSPHSIFSNPERSHSGENPLQMSDNGKANSLKTTKKRNIHATSITPITFFVRTEALDLLETHFQKDPAHLAILSPVAQQIYAYLKQKGASFIDNIVRGTQQLESFVERGLWELVAIGAVTSDSFDNLRALIDPKRRLNKGRGRRLPRFGSGRWYLLQEDEPIQKEKQLQAECWMLLKRYGVVFRDLLTKEKNIHAWRELLPFFRRLEAMGEIRGGRFVTTVVGEQFALPYALDSLRTTRDQSQTEEIKINLKLHPADPLNLVIFKEDISIGGF